MPTAFVTGGSGFIGGALIDRLRAEGWDVRALARSQGAEQKVRERGAVPLPGDLESEPMMREAAIGCDVAFHAAAKVEDWGDPEEFERLNVRGTENVIAACRGAGVRRLVHVGTEAALMAGRPLVNVDEGAPLRPDSPALYPSSKAKAERLVRDANDDGLETVVVRPRFVWGRGDTTLLPTLVELVRSGRFRWVGGGRHLRPRARPAASTSSPTASPSSSASSSRGSSRPKACRPRRDRCRRASHASPPAPPRACGEGCGAPAIRR
jgi:nucleoside-diphosphate-sugar epimerase